MAPVADEEATAAAAVVPDEAMDSESHPAGEEDQTDPNAGESPKTPESESSEEPKRIENAAEDLLGGVKEVDESAAESIAQPDITDEKLAEPEEIKGPELTSDHPPPKVDHHFLHPPQPQPPKIKESETDDVMNALYERMSSGVASAHSDGSKEGNQKDPVADSVMSAAAPYIQFAVAQAQVIKNSMEGTTDVAVRAACNQLGELQDSSTTHFYYAKDMYWRLKRDYREYENVFFTTLKDGAKAATASPALTAVLATGAAFVLFKRPRRFLFKHTLGRFRSQEAMLSSAQKRVVEMRQTFEGQKNERRKLEERFRSGEDEYLRGQSKMSNAGGQIRSLAKTIYKTENQAQSLVEKLRDISGKPALHLRAEVASMVSEAKQHRAALDKDLYKIANYNIRV